MVKSPKRKPKEDSKQKRLRAKKIVQALEDNYPEATCSLRFQNPFELLVATMLSAQCTDERVNKVTPALFKKYPTSQKMAKAKQQDVEALIQSTGFFRNKARNLIACSQQLVRDHKGQVPSTMEELHALAGVGRKTANVVLGNAFGTPGMVVDTHVTRISQRLGLSKGGSAEHIEAELEQVIEKENWVQFSHLLIEHGRKICKARKALCEECFLNTLCPQLL